MTLRLVQLAGPLVAAVDDQGVARIVRGIESTYSLALRAADQQSTLREVIEAQGLGEKVDLAAALAEGRVRAPVDHPDPAHVFVTGTGLTHLGSAEGRDKMHRDLADPAKLSDSMKMFKLGVEGGKPGPGERGVQPEWFYKGDGSIVVPPGAPLPSPAFARDGSEEPEIAGIYIIDARGVPMRIGFALGNEFSDHVTERANYLYLAHSKLRPCALGPELLTGELPAHVRGRSRIRRNGAVLWEKEFLSGEENMCHSLRNLEAHHFKYALFRRPGDVHIHFFGTATLSFSEGIVTQAGDVFEIEADAFTLPLRNTLEIEDEQPGRIGPVCIGKL
jgi:hypothetical protein